MLSSFPTPHSTRLAAALALALPAMLATRAQAQASTPEPERLAPVVVTATRTEAAPFEVPASITRIDGDALRAGRAQVNLSEGLSGVPGLLARDRQNYAQDVQISVRGFGARASFGIRGVRVYVDDIPATLPDGQGQITNVELGTVGRVEVLRGPFSALYGNSSGGVISVYSEAPAGPPRLDASVAFGSDGLRRVAVASSGKAGAIGYTLGASRFETEGYRQHSAAERRLANARLNFKLGADTQLTLIANSVELPEAQDPLGLTRAQWLADPRGVDPSALSFDTRKTMKQQQGGLVLEHGIDAANTLRVMVYQGHRTTTQFQAIPVATQANALHPGGVIDLARDYEGADIRWRWKSTTASVIAGIAADALREHRVGTQNFVGSVLGVQGALRRDETNRVSNADPYLQAQWQPAADWLLSAGVRRATVDFSSSDAYITKTNPDDGWRRPLHGHAAGAGRELRGGRAPAGVRHCRPGLRDAHAQRAGLPRQRRHGAELRPAGVRQPQRGSRREGAALGGHRPHAGAVRDRHRPRDRHADQRRRPRHLPERRRHAPPRAGGIGHAPAGALAAGPSSPPPG